MITHHLFYLLLNVDIPHGNNPQYRVIYKVYSINEVKSNPKQFDDIDLVSLENLEVIVDPISLQSREGFTDLYVQ